MKMTVIKLSQKLGENRKEKKEFLQDSPYIFQDRVFGVFDWENK